MGLSVCSVQVSSLRLYSTLWTCPQVAPGWRRVAPGGAVCSVMIVSILVQSPLVLLFPLRAVYLVQRVMHFASSRHPTDDFLLHFVHFDAKVRL